MATHTFKNLRVLECLMLAYLVPGSHFPQDAAVIQDKVTEAVLRYFKKKVGGTLTTAAS